MKIGKAKYGSEFVKTNYWKLKDGESTFRILPPLGELAENGIWSVFYKVHYGYRNSEGRMRVFQSCLVQDRKTRMVEVPDAAVERIENLRAELEKAKAAGNHMAVSKFKELLQMYNLDNNHYVNAIDLQGNIGVLKLRHRAKQALDAAIKKLNGANIDPLSPDAGRYFTFTRSGSGLDTTFQVAVAQKSITIEGIGEAKQDLVHRLTPEIVERLGREARDLSKLFKKPTADEIARIVKESDLNTGKSRAVDEIFDTRGGDTSTEGSDYESEDEGSGIATSGTSSNASLTTSDIVMNTASSTPSPSVGVAQSNQTAAAPTPSAQTTAQKVSNMNDDEFQKYLSTLGI